MDYDWTDSSNNFRHVHLNKFEEKCYRMATEDPDCPSFYEYGMDGYSEYCEDIRKHLQPYADLCGLSNESVNRIFEKYFMRKD